MNSFFGEIQYFLSIYWNYDFEEFWKLYIVIFPFVIFVEIPLYMLIIGAYLNKFWKDVFTPPIQPNYYPDVSCIITCYNEGEAIVATLRSLVEQIYKGNIEILVVIDGANVNKPTYNAAQSYAIKYHSEF